MVLRYHFLFLQVVRAYARCMLRSFIKRAQTVTPRRDVIHLLVEQASPEAELIVVGGSIQLSVHTLPALLIHTELFNCLQLLSRVTSGLIV